jgi:hypothetical protein
MGTITRSLANNITTGGVLLPASLVNNSIANVTAYNAAVATGGMKLISSQTANNSASISFTTGIDSTYKEYQFYFIDIHARTDGADFQFNGSTDAGSNYNVTKTTTYFQAYHFEDDSGAGLEYASAEDVVKSTALQSFFTGNCIVADEAGAGYLQLFNPSSTTYVKHFISTNNSYDASNISINQIPAGYFDTTSAVNAIQFKMSSGNFDGTILMFGIV